MSSTSTASGGWFSYFGRPRALVIGAILGALGGLPLIAALYFTISAYNPTVPTSNIIEIIMTSLALLASLFYVVVVLHVNPDRDVIKKLRDTVTKENYEVVGLVLLPFSLYMGVAIAAQASGMVQAVEGVQYDKDPQPTYTATGTPPYIYELDSVSRGLFLALSMIYIINVVLQFIAISLHVIGYRGFSQKPWVLAMAGICLGYLTSFNFIAFLVDINTTWSSGNTTYDNTLVTGYISFRFFTFCVFGNMAFLQPMYRKSNESGYGFKQSKADSDALEPKFTDRPISAHLTGPVVEPFGVTGTGR